MTTEDSKDLPLIIPVLTQTVGLILVIERYM